MCLYINYEILGCESTFGFIKRSFVVEKSDLETFVFELLDFLCIVFFGGEKTGSGLNMLGAKLSF